MIRISKLPGKIKRGGLCPYDVVIERELGYCSFKIIIENPNRYRVTTTILNIEHAVKVGTVLTGTTFKLPEKMNKKAQDKTLNYDLYASITYEKCLDIIKRANINILEWIPQISIENNKATIIFTE